MTKPPLHQFPPPDLSVFDYVNPHPECDAFGLMKEVELADLAQSIKDHGLNWPIVMDQDGRLIDGRNRLLACIMADVEPTFVEQHFEDDDAIRGYLWNVNGTFHSRPKNERTLAEARLDPTGTVLADSHNPTRNEDRELAREVLRRSPMEAWRMEGNYGSAHPSEVLGIIVDKERLAALRAGQIATIQANAPDLRSRIEDERMTWDEAIIEYAQRLIGQKLNTEAIPKEPPTRKRRGRR